MRLTQDIIRKLIKEQLQEALSNQEREDKISSIVTSLTNLEDADVSYILTQVDQRLSAKETNERKLTEPEKKKREEIAKAIEEEDPDMPMDKKMAIATAQAKKSA